MIRAQGMRRSRFPSLRPRLRRRWLAIPAILVATAAALLAFASPFQIDGPSMSSTIQPGEMVLVDRVSTSLGLQRGEIIIFHPPTNDPAVPYIKRIIGLPGDHVSIIGGVVFVNGQKLDEPYLAPNTTTTTSVYDFELTVPSGTVFVLGDDRPNSYDSRYFGPVPEANIIGQAWFAFIPSFPSLPIATL
jgi:signal peptidase I